MKCIYIILLILTINFFTLKSQDFRNGYIIKKESSDTIRGFVANRSAKNNSLMCQFKSNMSSKIEEFSPAQLIGFGITNYKQYESKIIPLNRQKKELIFIELIVKGKLSLYLYKYQKILYLEIKDSILVLEPPIVVKTLGWHKKDVRYIGQLNYIMVDCRQNNDKVSYNEASLATAIVKYNECKGVKPFEVKSKLAKFIVQGVLIGGLDRGSTSLQGLEKFSYVKSLSAPVGAGLRLCLPRLSDKFFGSLELFYDKKHYQVYDESFINGSITRADFLAKYSYLKMPIGVHYNFSQESSTLFIKGGFVHYFMFDLSGSVVSETETNGIVKKDVATYDYSAKDSNGFWFGGGFQKKIRKKNYSFIELRYELNNGFSNPRPASRSSGENLTLLFGLIF